MGTYSVVLTDDIPINPSLKFNDGVRSVDFVLAWVAGKYDATTPEAFQQRRVFEMNLEKEGLQLEREAPPDSHGLHFVKVHAPQAVLRDYSQVLKLRMSTKHSTPNDVHEKRNTLLDKVNDGCEKIMSKIKVNPTKFPEGEPTLTYVYSKDKEYLFDTTSDSFWTPSIRSQIVQFILDRNKFSEAQDDNIAFGIAPLLGKNVYSDAYPLHDGDLETLGSTRNLLYKEWANLSKCIKYQPLDCIKNYFGAPIGLYFAWLGFYTHMLIPASIVGLICVIYSAANVYSNVPSEEKCIFDSAIKMCPQCDYHCDFWDLRSLCLQSRITYLFDNSTMVYFTIFMTFWTACFLELWKRYSAELAHRWGLSGLDVEEEHARPQYLAHPACVKRTQLNNVTGEREPKIPFWRMRLPATLMSYSVVLALVAVIAVMLNSMTLQGVLRLMQEEQSINTSGPSLVTTATAVCLNLLFISIFNYLYQHVAVWLTEKEFHRTQTEFDNSLALKIYMLQFVNSYASIFYIAFIKGNFVGRPGNFVRFFGHRLEECSPNGCFLDLTIQLAITMIGKQFISALVEMSKPNLLICWKKFRTVGMKNTINSHLQWVTDFKLLNFGNMGLIPEYLEIVLQYGFMTIFVAAFPLAPLFALANNVLELRLDARKFLSWYSRPVPQRVTNIGVWYRILDCIGKLSIMTNGLIIAFTSDFIPRLVYYYENKHNMQNYIIHTLTNLNVSVFEHLPNDTHYTETICSYPGYWHWTGDGYQHSTSYWYVLAARLTFVVIYKTVVLLMMIVVRWAIPDVSNKLLRRMRIENYVIDSLIKKERTSTPDERERTRPATRHTNLLSSSPSLMPVDLAVPTVSLHGSS